MSLAPGTERNALAARFADAIRGSVGGSARKRQQFEQLRGSVYVVMNDPTPGSGGGPIAGRMSVAPGWGGALTMRFDLGQLTIHDGLVGVPDVTLRGDPSVIEGLTEMLPAPSGRGPGVLSSVRALRWIVKDGKLKVYGLRRHPRMTLGVLRVLSRHRW